jgi:competence ComEA-like helix-hairpin-helix protein
MLVCALTVASCVKLPRRHTDTISQAAPLVSRTEDGPAPRVNVNEASMAELEKLPGIGRGLAARIVAHRAEYGPFRRAEHVMMVRGISDRRFRAMRALITTE